MPRKTLLKTDEHPYHINIRTNNSEFFKLPMDQCWELFCEKSFYLSMIYGFEIHSAVLMSNHYHMILTTPDQNLAQGLCYFHREMSKTVNKMLNRRDHIFGARYFGKLILDEKYYLQSTKYLFRNPVKANLCNQVEEYPYSTLYGQLGFAPLKVRIYDRYQSLDFLNAFGLEWLNTPFNTEIEQKLHSNLYGKRQSSF